MGVDVVSLTSFSRITRDQYNVVAESIKNRIPQPRGGILSHPVDSGQVPEVMGMALESKAAP